MSDQHARIAEKVYEILKDRETRTLDEIAAEAAISHEELEKLIFSQLPEQKQ